MLKIRLQRIGKKNQASFRIILTDHRKSVKGKYQELLGNYNPRTKPSTINLKEDRIKYWLSVGAKPSATVHNILVDKKIINAKKIRAWRPKKKKEEKKEKASAEDKK